MGVDMVFRENMSVEEKLTILADAAKYDVACTSSGVDRKGRDGNVGNAEKCGICHTFAADGRCISLLKILYTNECIFDCKYCINRSSNDVERTSFTPEEVCTLTMEFYRRNYIEGLFLSSGVHKTPDYTMEQICKTLMLLREQYHFHGYIHCKAVPGASDEIIELCGWYADRMSVNLEMATSEGLKALAPHKQRKNILLPMRQIQEGIEESRQLLGMKGGNKGAFWHTKRMLEGKSIETKRKEDAVWLTDRMTPGKDGLKLLREDDMAYFDDDRPEVIEETSTSGHVSIKEFNKARNITAYKPESELSVIGGSTRSYSLKKIGNNRITERGFVPAGQSTQMVIGASNESDYQIINVAEALYSKFDLKRVFYSAFINVNNDSSLPILPGGPPLLREHRLYQADWLLRLYGFEASELLSEQRPNFNMFLDPKCDWAVAHLEHFPIEVNRADYFTLLRVPGIGMKSADRIVKARQMSKLTFEDLKKIGVVLKRAVYFITCSGKMMYPTKIDESYIVRHLLEQGDDLPDNMKKNLDMTYKQVSLFDDVKFSAGSF